MQDELTEILRRGANDAWGLGMTDAQIAQFARYAELLVEWNATRMNLTRLTGPRDIAVKHFLDSLAVLKSAVIPAGVSVIDVGTGAGLPGLAVQIARPDLRVTLLDSTAKKLGFCQAVADDLGLTQLRTVHGRAEDAGRDPAFAHRFQTVLARAVAPLERLLPWCAPFAAPGGQVIALKGGSVDAELPPARPAARRLGLTLRPPVSVDLPEAEEPLRHCLVIAARSGHPHA